MVFSLRKNFLWTLQLVLFACIAAASAAGPFKSFGNRPATGDVDAQVLRSDSDVRPDGYSYGYETSNKIAADEQGSVKNAGRENEFIDVNGQYSYTSPEGVPVKITYKADDLGFRPEGSAIPVAPPVPELIAR